MAINVFEGGRRITKLAITLYLIICSSAFIYIFIASDTTIRDIKPSAVLLLAPPFFIWLFSWATGWIVRGFMGIPTGQDKKGIGKEDPHSFQDKSDLDKKNQVSYPNKFKEFMKRLGLVCIAALAGAFITDKLVTKFYPYEGSTKSHQKIETEPHWNLSQNNVDDSSSAMPDNSPGYPRVPAAVEVDKLLNSKFYSTLKKLENSKEYVFIANLKKQWEKEEIGQYKATIVGILGDKDMDHKLKINTLRVYSLNGFLPSYIKDRYDYTGEKK